MAKETDTIILTLKRSGKKLYLENNRGDEWEFSSNIRDRAAIATLVYGTILHRDEELSTYSSDYEITLSVKILK